MTYQPRHPSRYYRLRAIDCERTAADATTTVAEQSIMLRCAARWHKLADNGPVSSDQGGDLEQSNEAER